MSVPRRLGYSPAPQHSSLADRMQILQQQQQQQYNNNQSSHSFSSSDQSNSGSQSPRAPLTISNNNTSISNSNSNSNNNNNNGGDSPSHSPGQAYRSGLGISSMKSGSSSQQRLQMLTPLKNHMRKQGSQDGSMIDSDSSNSILSNNQQQAVSILAGSHSPKSMSQLLYSPKPSPGMRVSVPSPAPSVPAAQNAPQSYATLPALDRSHRYVITGTLQQSLFGVVKLAFDRKLKCHPM